MRPKVADRNIGIEVEVESERLPQRQASNFVSSATSSGVWEVVSEGSLRGGELGWEIRTRGANGRSAQEVRAAMNEMAVLLLHNSGTWRAAVHVHVDVRDMRSDMRALSALLAVLYCFDSSLFAQYSPHRKESNFCVPLHNITPHAIATIKGLAEGNINPDNIRWNKYSSCNLRAVSTHGSVEFRHMQTPSVGGHLPQALRAVRDIWNYAHAVSQIVETVSLHRHTTLSNLLGIAETITGYRLSPEDALTVLSASKTNIVQGLTDSDLGSIVAAAGSEGGPSPEGPERSRVRFEVEDGIPTQADVETVLEFDATLAEDEQDVEVEFVEFGDEEPDVPVASEEGEH